jgi:hypothetical protein
LLASLRAILAEALEFHLVAKGAIRRGVQEKRFKSGEQWEVLRREDGIVIIGKEGVEKQLPLDTASLLAASGPSSSQVRRRLISTLGSVLTEQLQSNRMGETSSR